MKKQFRNLFEKQASQIKSLATRGIWCGYQNQKTRPEVFSDCDHQTTTDRTHFALGVRVSPDCLEFVMEKEDTITYDSLTYSNSNMDITETPLDINSGILTLKMEVFYIYLRLIFCISGIFTVPVSGAWRVSFSMQSQVQSKEANHAFLYLNGDQLPESKHDTYSSSSLVTTSGREVILEARKGDSIKLKMKRGWGYNGYWDTSFCAEYINTNL